MQIFCISKKKFKNINRIKGIEPICNDNSRNIAEKEKNSQISTIISGRCQIFKLKKELKRNGGIDVIIAFLIS